MIKGHEQLKVPDINKQHELVIEVNWNPKDPKTNECKVLRLIYPNGDTALVKKEHMHAILFAIGNEEEQRKMTPVKTTRSRWYETVVSVKAKRAIAAGEDITFPIKLTLPTLEEEVIGEMKRELLEKGGIKIKNK